ncbi:MAG TPA: 4-(cytidine 5'-diphospho)-2-C-methyl-D-erythritol kinase [Dissulfurispiraceae bacterium]|nr:4-(cytidine 5'-diphospho)-2-C-methyl-D-erythritol kinase [Dissulfurispiraceae bacterium]
MITLHAPAKINWSLYVLGKRNDGYHNILSLMQLIGLYDTITFEKAADIELHCDMHMPQEQNLVFRAAVLLKEQKHTALGAKITLQKEIPSGAGLGGGSSDAAYTLMGLNQLWGLGLKQQELMDLAISLGSDVPFFLAGSAAIVKGRGEVLHPVILLKAHSVLIVKPEVSVSTGWAYGMIDVSRINMDMVQNLTNNEEKLNNIKLIIRTLEDGHLHSLQMALHNDFEMAVFEKHPEIGEIKHKMLVAGAAAALMSGSGSAVFGLFETYEKAVETAALFPSFWNRIVGTHQAGNDGLAFTH